MSVIYGDANQNETQTWNAGHGLTFDSRTQLMYNTLQTTRTKPTPIKRICTGVTVITGAPLQDVEETTARTLEMVKLSVASKSDSHIPRIVEQERESISFFPFHFSWVVR